MAALKAAGGGQGGPGGLILLTGATGYVGGRLLRLAAEMRAPGRAWLQFEVSPAPGGALLRQMAIHDPVALGEAAEG